MQMFDNFENQDPNYIPNNMFPVLPIRQVEVDGETVKPIYRNCKLVGYEWNWGDKVSIAIKNQIHINLPAYAIYTFEDEDPTTETEGFIGQCYYNLNKLKSFVLESIIENDDESVEYVWVQDEKFTFPEIGASSVDVPIALKDGEQIVVQLFNFRKERIRDDVYYHPFITWNLTPEESLHLVPGIYFLNVHLETREQVAEEEFVSTNLRLTNSYEIVVKGF